MRCLVALTAGLLLCIFVTDAGAQINMGAERVIQYGQYGWPVQVDQYSVPSYVDWNNDGKKDLIVGYKTLSGKGAIRIYLNVGTASEPAFDGYFSPLTQGSEFTCPASGCMGCFPRVVYWDGDMRKDLLVGTASGKIMVFLNIATDEDPEFGGLDYLDYGPEGAKSDINVGGRATLEIVDWNNDGRQDLLAGGFDGRIRLYINESNEGAPVFLEETFVTTVPGYRSSPAVADMDGDGMKDLIAGNTYGELLFYRNIGSDDTPEFYGFTYIRAEGVKIDLTGSPRSRPFVCDWDDDGLVDILVGAYDGKVRLYEGYPVGDINRDKWVGIDDFAMLSQWWLWGNCQDCKGTDVDWDGEVSMNDLLFMVNNWLQ